MENTGLKSWGFAFKKGLFGENKTSDVGFEKKNKGSQLGYQKVHEERE